jgi:hypothetical protein
MGGKEDACEGLSMCRDRNTKIEAEFHGRELEASIAHTLHSALYEWQPTGHGDDLLPNPCRARGGKALFKVGDAVWGKSVHGQEDGDG